LPSQADAAVWTSLWRRLWRKGGDDCASHGLQSWLRWTDGDSFFPPRVGEAPVLEEGIGDHGHQRMAVKALQGTPLEVIETEFLFHLLMRLFT
jgi:hypothetical protein